MTCVSKSAFWNVVACKIQRPVAKVIPVLLNTAWCYPTSKMTKQTFDFKLKTFDRDVNAIYETFNLFKDGFC